MKRILLFLAALLLPVCCAAQSNEPSTVTVTRTTPSQACAGMMALFFPQICQPMAVASASSQNPDVIGFYFVLSYSGASGQSESASQTVFARQGSSFVASFPLAASAKIQSVMAMPLIADGPPAIAKGEQQ